MKLLIGIVNFDTKKYLYECLKTVYANKPFYQFKVVVVDNNSTDGSIEMVNKFFPEVLVIANQNNLGYARACNQLANKFTCQYICFLNPDVLVHPKTFDYIVRFLDENKNIGACGCKNLDVDGKPQPSILRFPTALQVFLDTLFPERSIKLSKFKDSTRPKSVNYLLGSFMILRKNVFDSIGGFDENFFLYAEEIDLFLRIRERGYKIYYLPQVKVTHIQGASTSQNRVFCRTQNYRSLFYIYKKYKPHKLDIVYKTTKVALWVRRYFPQINRTEKDLARDVYNNISLKDLL